MDKLVAMETLSSVHQGFHTNFIVFPNDLPHINHGILQTCQKSPFREMNVVGIVKVGNCVSTEMMNPIESGLWPI